jgi:hypothetical protein
MTADLLAAIADVHLGSHTVLAGPLVAGVNDRAHMVADVLRRAVDTAAQNGARALVVCGDLIDVDAPPPQILALAVEALSDATVPVLILPGNHDQRTMLRGDHALGALAAAPMVRVIDAAAVVRLPHLDLCIVPFQMDDARRYIPAALAALAVRCRPGVRRAVAVHAGISDARTPPFLSGSHEAIPAESLLAAMQEHGYDLALAGNWHDHQRWTDGSGRWVVQCGALVPTGFDNPGGAGKYGSVILARPGETPTREELNGPRFFRVSTLPELAAAVADPTAAPRFVHVHGITAQAAPEWSARLAALKSAGAIHAYRLRTLIPGTARMDAAVHVVRSAATFDEAVTAYVSGMTLPAGVTRDDVVTATRAFLGQTGASADPPLLELDPL